MVGFSELGRLSVGFEFHGRRQTFAFDSWPLPGLTRQITAIFANAVASDAWVTGIGSAEALYYAARHFVRHLRAEAPDADSLRVGSLTADHLDGFDAALHERYPHSSTGGSVLMPGLRMLREADLRAAEQRDCEVDAIEPVPALTAMALLPETRARVGWVSRFDEPEGQPLDAYAPAFATMLREATEKDIDDVIRRITVDGERMVAEGQPPTSGQPLRARDVVWLINADGPLSQETVRARFGRQDHIKVSELNRLVFPAERAWLPGPGQLGHLSGPHGPPQERLRWSTGRVVLGVPGVEVSLGAVLEAGAAVGEPGQKVDGSVDALVSFVCDRVAQRSVFCLPPQPSQSFQVAKRWMIWACSGGSMSARRWASQRSKSMGCLSMRGKTLWCISRSRTKEAARQFGCCASASCVSGSSPRARAERRAGPCD